MSLTTTIGAAVVAAALSITGITFGAGTTSAPATLDDVQFSQLALPQAATGSAVCDGKKLRRTLVRSVAGPLTIDQVASTETQLTTSKSQGSSELLIITFAGTVIKDGANLVGAAIRVDGKTVEPSDFGCSTVLDSPGWSAAAVTITRCLRVKPGKHKISVSIGANLGGPAYLREYTIRIDQYN